MIDGYGISDLQTDEDGTPKIEPDDIQNGYIYVLRSLSRNPKIRQMRNLYKIGYCSGDVTTRIQNSAKEPTYLMSDVEVILTARCYNLDVPYLEANIHRFFSGTITSHPNSRQIIVEDFCRNAVLKTAGRLTPFKVFTCRITVKRPTRIVYCLGAE